jgi:predicted DNA-binding transcriptional regulator YafY
VAAHRGAVRTYRISRVRAATVLDEPAAARPLLPLAELWQQRRRDSWAGLAAFTVLARIRDGRRGDLVAAARAADVPDEETVRGTPEGWQAVRVTFADRAHASGVLWQLGADVRVLEPAELRVDLAGRAADVLAGYGQPAPAAR